MSRTKALALLASFAVMLSTLVGVTLTSTAASAAPKFRYPPPPPSVVVQNGVVKKGNTVRAAGRKYKARERVTITVRFKPKGSNRYRVIKVTSVRADRNGRFYFNVRTSRPGTIVITATGRSSRKSASAFVTVTDKRRWGRGWAMQPVAFTGGSDASVAAPRSGAPAEDGSGLAIAGLAMMTMAGSAVVTQRVVRRRRKASVAA
jgi:hypothetical protein